MWCKHKDLHLQYLKEVDSKHRDTNGPLEETGPHITKFIAGTPPGGVSVTSKKNKILIFCCLKKHLASSIHYAQVKHYCFL